MGTETKIGWCDHTANLWWGCQEVHAGCDHCYARTWDKRMGGAHWGAHAPRRAIKSVWSDLEKWQAAAKAEGVQRRVFCGSMMDIFEVSKPLVDHKGKEIEGRTMDLRGQLFRVVRSSPNLLFLFLTKRPQNILRMIPPSWLSNPPANVMYGYSAVNQETAGQGIPHLLKVPGRHFLSCEPLIGAIDLEPFYQVNQVVGPEVEWRRGTIGVKDLPLRRAARFEPNIDWVICGGESGHGARPMAIEWASKLRYQCDANNIPFFMKQLGGHPDKRESLEDIPVGLRVREFPRKVKV